MGFGSYDESEQREVEADFDEEEGVDDRTAHSGSLEFENGASSDELLDRLQDIKDEE
ncbi:MAG: DUF5786 family protein [Natrialbaceae archaeon]|nr:DUF5786 family protein [Natrialbaceae archaeon]